jgi:hypothetical protein
VFVLATDSPLEKNENGQTYGSVSGRSIEDVPDLVAARGIDGITVGYVKSTDLFSPLPSSPEEAVKMQLEKDARGLYTIPLYESDGKTVIGEFLMGNGSPEEVEAFINSRLNKN